MNDIFNPPGSLPPRSNNALPPGSVVGAFTIQYLVGEGRFGLVYRAVDNVTQADVAVHEYLPSMLAGRSPDGDVELRSLQYESTFQAGLESFISEAKLLAQLDHKALVKVLRSFEAHGTAYMVMPFHEGRTLNEILRESPRIDEPSLKAMLAPLLDALEALHRARCLHCDVAPDNILMLDDGGPVLLNFGAARRVIGKMTESMTSVLRAGYAAVEQYADDSSTQLGPWTDIYALAAVMRFAITGKPPPPSVTRVARDPMKPLAQLATRFGPSFVRAIDRGLAVRPDDRPRTIAQFRQALGLVVVSIRLPMPAPITASSAPPVAPQRARAVLEPRPASSPPPVSPPPPASSRHEPTSVASSRLQPLTIAIVLATILAVLGAGYLAMQSTTPEPSPDGVARAPAQTSPVPPPLVPAPGPTPPAAQADLTPPAEPAPPAASRSPQSADALAAPAPPVTPKPATGPVVLDVKPWGEVVIDGRVRGLTPPLKVLQLPEGPHRIEVRNSVGPTLVREVTVTASGRVEISHTFK